MEHIGLIAHSTGDFRVVPTRQTDQTSLTKSPVKMSQGSVPNATGQYGFCAGNATGGAVGKNSNIVPSLPTLLGQLKRESTSTATRGQ